MFSERLFVLRRTIWVRLCGLLSGSVVTRKSS
jgi:hypothetical protein